MRLSTFILAAALAAGAVAKPAGLSQRSNPSVTSSAYPSASSRAPSESNSTANNQDLINKLELAATAVDRIGLIPNDHDFVYDFLNPPPDGAITAGKGTTIFP